MLHYLTSTVYQQEVFYRQYSYSMQEVFMMLHNLIKIPTVHIYIQAIATVTHRSWHFLYIYI